MPANAASGRDIDAARDAGEGYAESGQQNPQASPAYAPPSWVSTQDVKRAAEWQADYDQQHGIRREENGETAGYEAQDGRDMDIGENAISQRPVAQTLSAEDFARGWKWARENGKLDSYTPLWAQEEALTQNLLGGYGEYANVLDGLRRDVGTAAQPGNGDSQNLGLTNTIGNDYSHDDTNQLAHDNIESSSTEYTESAREQTAEPESKLSKRPKGNEEKDPYRRPSRQRKGVREKVLENAKDENGIVRDPATGEVIAPGDPWDMGHKPKYEFRKHKDSARDRNIDRKKFLDEYNNPNHYRPEKPSSNRRHLGEDLTDAYEGP